MGALLTPAVSTSSGRLLGLLGALTLGKTERGVSLGLGNSPSLAESGASQVKCRVESGSPMPALIQLLLLGGLGPVLSTLVSASCEWQLLVL